MEGKLVHFSRMTAARPADINKKMGLTESKITAGRVFVCLAVIWAAAIATRIALFTGYVNGDMGNYVKEAFNLANGQYSIIGMIQGTALEELVPDGNFNWQNLRLGLIVPVSVLFRVFGVSEFSYAVFTFGCFTLGLAVTYHLGRELVSGEFGLLSALIYAFVPVEINLSTILTPHIPSSSFMAASCLFFLKGSRSNGARSSAYMFLSGLFLSVAYLIWEFALILMPVLFAYLALHNGPKRFLLSRGFWASALALMAGFVPLYAAETIYFYGVSGVLFFRSKFISVMSPKWIELHPIDLASTGFLNYPKGMFLSYYFGVFYYLVLAGVVAALSGYFSMPSPGGKRDFKLAFPLIWMTILGLYLEFGTSSFSSYQPVYKLNHYLVVVSVPASMFATYLILNLPFQGLIERLGWKRPYISRGYAVAALTAVFVSFSILCSYQNFRGNGPYRRDVTYEHRIKEALDKLPNGVPIYTDLWTKNGLDFVYGYSREVIPFNSLSAASGRSFDFSGINSGYIVVNNIYLSSEHLMKTHVPAEIYSLPGKWKLVSSVAGRSKSVDIYSTVETIN